MAKQPKTVKEAKPVVAIERVVVETRTHEGIQQVRKITVKGGQGKQAKEDKLVAFKYADDSFDGFLALYNGIVSLNECERSSKDKGDAKHIDGRIAAYYERNSYGLDNCTHYIFGTANAAGVRGGSNAIVMIPQQSEETQELRYVKLPDAIQKDKETGADVAITVDGLRSWWRMLFYYGIYGVADWVKKSGSTKAKGSVSYTSTRGDKVSIGFADLLTSIERHGITRISGIVIKGFAGEEQPFELELKQDQKSFDKAIKANGGLSGLDAVQARAKAAEQVKADKANDAAAKAAEKAAIKAAKAQLKQDEANNVGNVSGEQFAAVVNG